MSTTSLLAIPKRGEIYTVEEYRNSHLWGPLVWDKLATDYLKWQRFGMGFDLQPVWNLYKAPPSVFDNRLRLALMATFDWAVCERKDLLALADGLEYFHKRYPAEQVEYSSHCLRMAFDIRKLAKKNIFGICWQGTSTCEDFWYLDKEERMAKLSDIRAGRFDRLFIFSPDKKYWEGEE